MHGNKITEGKPCRKGHPYSRTNISKGSTHCRACVKENKKKMLKRLLWRSILNKAQKRAKMMNMPCDLNADWARKVWTGKCELTGITFAKTDGHRSAFTPSIDRIKPEKGYIQENCRFVIWAINAFKCDFSDEEMYRIAEALIEKKKGSRRQARAPISQLPAEG